MPAEAALQRNSGETANQISNFIPLFARPLLGGVICLLLVAHDQLLVSPRRVDSDGVFWPQVAKHIWY